MCSTLRMATRSVARLYDQALAPAGLRAASYSILSRLDAEGPMTITRLAARLALERTTCSREVEALAKAGLLHVEVGQDRRRRLVQASPEGARRLAESRPHWIAVQRRIEGAFGSEDTAHLLDRLRTLHRQSERLAAG